jgi:hypothetical protein
MMMTESCPEGGGIFGNGGASLGTSALLDCGCGLGAMAMTVLLNVLIREYAVSVIHRLGPRQLPKRWSRSKDDLQPVRSHLNRRWPLTWSVR